MRLFFICVMAATFLAGGSLANAQPPRERSIVSPFGVRVHLNWIHVYSPADRAKALALIREAGIGCVSFGFNWGSIEPVKGHFFFEFYDTLVQECHDAGLQIEAVVGYSSDWASSAPKNAEKRWILAPPGKQGLRDFRANTRKALRRPNTLLGVLE